MSGLPTLYALIRKLADGKFHSGASLGLSLGISRAAVWKALQQCHSHGLELQAVSGKGYRLETPLELLDESLITQLISPARRERLTHLQVHQQLDSTNSFLLQAANVGAAGGMVCLAEQQSQGRGRRGRLWVSPYGANLYLSLLWRFQDGTARLTGLSLATGVALMRAFSRLGISNVGLKWPNDLLSEKGKVAGILIDVAGESNGPCHAVIGIGINHTMPVTVGNLIDQPWDDVRSLHAGIGRNMLAGVVIDELISMLTVYEQYGFDPFFDEWSSHDLLRGKPVTVQLVNKTIDGIAQGIDSRGLLQVIHGDVETAFSTGEVSVRCG